MTQFEKLKQIAANPLGDQSRRMTAREIIEARLGRKLPPVADMRPDERRAVKGLAVQLIRRRLQSERKANET
jgi:hypothetical protein